ncbi:hypothetical protein N7490_002145 [Penicillium lividum]|nr:hypothetical protein N7490_002145 [Penicillium lividum]
MFQGPEIPALQPLRAGRRAATGEQYKNKTVQPVHIYYDEEGRYTGHVLYAERDMKPSDE